MKCVRSWGERDSEKRALDVLYQLLDVLDGGDDQVRMRTYLSNAIVGAGNPYGGPKQSRQESVIPERATGWRAIQRWHMQLRREP